MNLVKILTPINIKEEKEKFFNSNSYSPIFKYDFSNININNLGNSLKHKLIKAIIEGNNKEIINYALDYFNTDLERFTNEANLIIYKGFKVNNDDIKDIENEFKKAIDLLNINYTLNIVDKYGFNFRPDYLNNSLEVSKYIRLGLFSARSEIQHEFTHIIRYINHKYNNLANDDKYLTVEEGLATLMQDNTRRINYSSYQHAAEYLASNIGLEGSLRDIYNYFISLGFHKDLAWQRSIRHKFGFVDTSESGDIIKPAMYFYHSNILNKLTKDEILQLFSGRISLNNLKLIKDYKGTIPKDLIIQFFDYFN